MISNVEAKLTERDKSIETCVIDRSRQIALKWGKRMKMTKEDWMNYFASKIPLHMHSIKIATKTCDSFFIFFFFFIDNRKEKDSNEIRYMPIKRIDNNIKWITIIITSLSFGEQHFSQIIFYSFAHFLHVHCHCLAKSSAILLIDLLKIKMYFFSLIFNQKMVENWEKDYFLQLWNIFF